MDSMRSIDGIMENHIRCVSDTPRMLECIYLDIKYVVVIHNKISKVIRRRVLIARSSSSRLRNPFRLIWKFLANTLLERLMHACLQSVPTQCWGTPDLI